jgi:hypothetical protein
LAFLQWAIFVFLLFLDRVLCAIRQADLLVCWKLLLLPSPFFEGVVQVLDDSPLGVIVIHDRVEISGLILLLEAIPVSNALLVLRDFLVVGSDAELEVIASR